MLTDGPRLYVQENVNGRFIIAQVSTNGGESVPISTPFPNVALANLSPDRSELMVGSFTGTGNGSTPMVPPVAERLSPQTDDVSGQDVIRTADGGLLISHGNGLVAVRPNGAGTFQFFTFADPLRPRIGCAGPRTGRFCGFPLLMQIVIAWEKFPAQVRIIVCCFLIGVPKISCNTAIGHLTESFFSSNSSTMAVQTSGPCARREIGSTNKL